MSLITLANAITEVRRRINEPTANFISDAEITEWLNRGARNVSSTVLSNWTTETDTMTATLQFVYTTTAEFIKAAGAVYTSTAGLAYHGLRRMRLQEIGHTKAQDTTGDRPLGYILWGGNMIYWPAPGSTATSAGDKVVVYGYIIEDNYTDGNLQDYVGLLPITYAVAMAHIKLGNHSKSALEFKRYMSGIMMARRDFGFGRTEEVEGYDVSKIPDITVYPEQG
jgi:hypothetical protein